MDVWIAGEEQENGSELQRVSCSSLEHLGKSLPIVEGLNLVFDPSGHCIQFVQANLEPPGLSKNDIPSSDAGDEGPSPK
jgi:hypothetical protein